MLKCGVYRELHKRGWETLVLGELNEFAGGMLKHVHRPVRRIIIARAEEPARTCAGPTLTFPLIILHHFL